MNDVRREQAGRRPEAGVTRRTVAREVLGGGLVAALLTATGRLDALAQATPDAGGQADVVDDRLLGLAARYVLAGGGTEIVFEPGPAGGAAQLDYRDAALSLSFVGDELGEARVQPLGPLFWVVLETVPDAYVRYLTLVVPEVNRPEDGSAVPLRTLAISTMQRTSIGGPRLVEGALQRHEVVELAGVAEFG